MIHAKRMFALQVSGAGGPKISIPKADQPQGASTLVPAGSVFKITATIDETGKGLEKWTQVGLSGLPAGYNDPFGSDATITKTGYSAPLSQFVPGASGTVFALHVQSPGDPSKGYAPINWTGLYDSQATMLAHVEHPNDNGGWNIMWAERAPIKVVMGRPPSGEKAGPDRFSGPSENKGMVIHVPAAPNKPISDNVPWHALDQIHADLGPQGGNLGTSPNWLQAGSVSDLPPSAKEKLEGFSRYTVYTLKPDVAKQWGVLNNSPIYGLRISRPGNDNGDWVCLFDSKQLFADTETQDDAGWSDRLKY